MTGLGGTRLERAIAPLAAGHPGRSGVFPLADGRDAFAARLLLAEMAERTLDVQCYIWADDRTGNLMFKALRDAAARGVRVRLLLDDNNTTGLDELLAELDAQANLEVRLFNPMRFRRLRWINYLADFSRSNRRMHNKSLTADAAAVIVGGRNVADTYFDATDDIVFADLDVLAIGPVASDVAFDFERYWNSDSSCPARRLLPRLTPVRRARVAERADQLVRSPVAAAYLQAVRELPLVQQLLTGELPFEWASVQLLSDDPVKLHTRAGRRQQVSFGIESIVGDAATHFDLISAYFVPTARGVEVLVELSRRGVAIRVLTNSLATTDVEVVHAGYAKWRKALLRAGIELREWRLAPLAAPKHKRIGGRPRWAGSAGRGSVASLHAKTFAVDRCRVFIGSFNFDPRSAYLNTELGFVIDSPALAASIEAVVEERLPSTTWKLSVSARGALRWSGQHDGQPEEHATEPDTQFHQRAAVWLLSWLPIDWLL